MYIIYIIYIYYIYIYYLLYILYIYIYIYIYIYKYIYFRKLVESVVLLGFKGLTILTGKHCVFYNRDF